MAAWRILRSAGRLGGRATGLCTGVLCFGGLGCFSAAGQDVCSSQPLGTGASRGLKLRQQLLVFLCAPKTPRYPCAVPVNLLPNDVSGARPYFTSSLSLNL